MSKALIVGISGQAGTGKDTLADLLVNYTNSMTSSLADKRSFAGPLKGMLNHLFGWEPKLWEDREWKETPQAVLFGKSPRELAQTLGTEWGRNCISPKFWADRAISMARALYVYDLVVFPDVRFAEEAEQVDILIHLTRGGVSPVAQHASENGYDSYKHLVDYHFDNSKSLADLAAFAEHIYTVEVAKRG